MQAYDTMFSIRRLWIILVTSMVVMFGTLLYFGGEIYQSAPPIPAAVRISRTFSPVDRPLPAHCASSMRFPFKRHSRPMKRQA
jgi:hypothetical protein